MASQGVAANVWSAFQDQLARGMRLRVADLAVGNHEDDHRILPDTPALRPLLHRAIPRQRPGLPAAPGARQLLARPGDGQDEGSRRRQSIAGGAQRPRGINGSRAASSRLAYGTKVQLSSGPAAPHHPWRRRDRGFWRFVLVQQEAAALHKTAIHYPPMQDPASFNLDAVKREIDKGHPSALGPIGTPKSCPAMPASRPSSRGAARGAGHRGHQARRIDAAETGGPPRWPDRAPSRS